MNKTLKKFIAVFAVASMFLSSTAFAATMNNDSQDYYVFRTTNKSGTNGAANSWSRSTTIGAGDIVSFAIYYHVTSGTAENVTFKMENITGRTFQSGSTETVSGQVSSSNAGTSAGTSDIRFDDTVTLRLYNVSWQPNQCTSVTCEQQFSGSSNNIIGGTGVNVGSINQGWPTQGSMVVTFKADAAGGDPENQNCTLNGVTVNHGSSRTFYSATTVSNGTCSGISQTRTCNNGTLSGSNNYQYSTCSVTGNNDVPAVTTNSATSVDEDSAVLNGYVDFSDDVDSGQVYFQYGNTQGNLSNSTSQINRSADGSFAQTISNLQEDRTYYFRAVTRGDDNNLYYGSTRSFTTDDDGGNTGGDEATVQTNSATSVDEDSARLNGEVTEGDNVEVWFAFDEDDSTPSCSDSSQRENVSGDYDDGDDFSRVITGLDENEEYFYRACGRGDDGDTVSGSIRSFTTDDEDNNNNNVDADVDTLAASSVDEDSARLNGEITDGDNVEAWFVYSTNTTPSCTSSTGRVSVSGSFDDGDDFGKVVTGLRDNTRYYFRACALGDDGERVSGAIRNFTTDEDDDNNNNTDISVVTRIASGITTNSATVRSFVEGEGNGACFFQYGTTTAFGNATNRVSIDLDDVTECAALVTNLRSNTGYFYRAVLEADGRTVFGGTQSFRTNSNPTLPPVTPPPTPNNPNPRPEVPRDEIEVMKWVASESDPEFDTFARAYRGEPVFYRVRITNTTDETLEDVTVIDRIPFYLELAEDDSLDVDSEKQIRWFLTRLEAGETKTYLTEMRLREDARVGDEIESFASASNDDISVTSNDVVVEVERGEGDDFVPEDEDDRDNQAAFIFGAGFFPTTMVGWLLLFVVVLAMAYLISRILFSRNENKKVLEELRVMQK